jgi:exoribonuclease-2
MGLHEISPALSIGIDLGEGGEIAGIHITPSHVKVTRLSYAEADAQINTEPLAPLWQIAQNNRARRLANGSTEIELPELKVRVKEDGIVRLKPIEALNSRELVREAMLLAGEAVGRFAIENEIPLPFSSQPPRREYDGTLPEGIAGMFAIRRTFRPGKRTTQSNPHNGLGMDVYVQVTSPLRRYLDLVVHQQLRAFLRGETPLDESQIYQRIGAVDAVAGNVRRAGRLSERHWTLIYLLQNPDWEGEGLVMEANGNRHLVLIPELDVETTVYLPHQHKLNEKIKLKFDSVNIPELEANFRPL